MSYTLSEGISIRYLSVVKKQKEKQNKTNLFFRVYKVTSSNSSTGEGC